ncbi:MAG TPA: hypothetical protein VG873_18010 [Burkholderiales bacterium]|nr:hypothetical protein [Burkholderiales bacterium]
MDKRDGMKRWCDIIYVQSGRGWKWRAIAPAGEAAPEPCKETYQLFYDCVTAARARGYTENMKCL